MKSRKFKIGIAISIIFMAIAYASVTAILNMNGKISIKANDFIVFFKTLNINGKNSYSSVSPTGGSFTLDYKDLLSGELKINYEVMNRSSEYDANVKVVCAPENASYLDINDKTGVMNITALTSKNGEMSLKMDPTVLMSEKYKNNEASSNKGYTNLYEMLASKSTLDNTKSIYVESNKGIDFKNGASFSNGNGLYQDSNSIQTKYPINYYRGNVDDNNVIFGDLCWKILRTTETGGTKLIYNGPVSNGTCPGSTNVIGEAKFNDDDTSASYSGFMYGTSYKNLSIASSEAIKYVFGKEINYTKSGSSGSYSLVNAKTFSNISDALSEIGDYQYSCFTNDINGTCDSIKYIYHASDSNFDYIEISNGEDLTTVKKNLKSNINNSTIKTSLEMWYEDNLKNYTYYLEDTPYYNDRSTIFALNATITDNVLYYRSLNKPKFSYSAKADSFTVNSNNGNGNLKYPIGLITVDEVISSGMIKGNVNNYLTSSKGYWTMSPSGINNLVAQNYYVSSSNDISSYGVNNSLGVRPVISLNNQVIVESGDGSSSLPYIVAQKPVKCSLSIDLIKRENPPEDSYLSNNLYEHITLSSKGNADNINFHEASSDYSGVYSTNKTDSGEDVYFYRGDIDNNNVIFADTCWKIIRTTENEEIRLLYNGIPTSYGTCDNSGVAATLGKSQYNSINTDNAYVGYMYGTANSSSYTATHKNTNSSIIKQKIDLWYEEHIKDTEFEELVADAVYCSDRSMTKDSSNKDSSLNDWINYSSLTLNGYAKQNTLYSASMRIGTSVKNTSPSLKCANANDRLTTEIGLKYPIALPTADEIVFAGAVGATLRYTTPPTNKNYFSLFSEMKDSSVADDLHFWTMTPQRHTGGTVTTMLAISQYGYTTNEVVQNERYVRPVITLKTSATILDGNGSEYAPYVITKSKSQVPTKWQDNGIFSAYYNQAYELLKTMTLDEKIGQLLNVGYGSSREAIALNKGVGGFTLYAEDFKDKSKTEVQNFINRLQNGSKIPLIMSVDEEGGSVVRISSNTQLASSKFESPQEIYGDGSKGFEPFKTDTVNKSALLRELGLNVNFAPVVDIAKSTSYIYKRTLGKGPIETAEYAKTVVESSKGTQVSYCLKHFPGYGNNSDTHTGSSVDQTSLEELMNTHVVPFKTAIESGAEAVMISHNTVSALDTENPASLSPAVHNLLFNDLHFTGIAITDNLDMDAAKNVANRYTKALLAGNNILLIYNTEEAFNDIKTSLNNGTLTLEMIEKLAFKVLAWKYYKGLL